METQYFDTIPPATVDLDIRSGNPVQGKYQIAGIEFVATIELDVVAQRKSECLVTGLLSRHGRLQFELSHIFVVRHRYPKPKRIAVDQDRRE